MLGVDNDRLTALLLHLCDSVDSQRRLTRRLGAVDLDDTTAGIAAYAESVVEVDRASGDDVDIGRGAGSHVHDRTLTVGLLDLTEDGLEGLQLGLILGLLLFILSALGELYFFTHVEVVYLYVGSGRARD